ncbi:MAG: transcription termination factor NusA [Phycisphaerae bacterium]
MSQDLLRHIESICRDKNIDRDSFVADLEAAMTSALRKAYVTAEAAEVKLDLLSGAISATVDNHPIDMHTLGRIAAQTAKQVIIQKTRERERTSIFEEYTEKRGTIITGTVSRVEGGNIIVQLVRGEGFLPRSEQIPGETHQPGERIRVLILEVREQPNQVKIILSRSHPEFVARLFELEVPEVAERIIEIKALAREAGYRSKVAVSSIDSKVDAVGACVGVRGSRIKNIVEELNNEKIDIVRWNESSQILIQNALKPAEVTEIALCFELGKATVVVAEDQLSLAIGKRGQNVRLASRLTGWDVDILTPTEYNRHLEALERTIKSIVGDNDILMDKFVAMGCVSVADVDEIGPDSFVKELGIDQPTAERIVEACGEEAIRQEEEREKLDREKAAMRAALAATGGVAAPSEAAPSGFTAVEGLPAGEGSSDGASGDAGAESTGQRAGDDTTAGPAQSTEGEGSVGTPTGGALVEHGDPDDATAALSDSPPSEPERRVGE